MISAPTVRALRAADVKPLARVLAHTHESEHNFELPLEGYLQRRAAATFVADIGGRPAGLVIGNDTTVFVSGRRGAVDGFAVAQPRSELLGPVVAPDTGEAARLIDASRARLPVAHRFNVPSGNRGAQALLSARGYRCSRSLAHMLLGMPAQAVRDRIFARINLCHG